MTIRADIAELLRAGLSDRTIARQLHTDAKKVAATRTALGLPKAKSGIRPADTPTDLYYRHTKALDNGHTEWTGSVSNEGVPALRHGGRQLSVYRIAYRLRTGREPIGHVRPACGMPQCVTPDHLDDRDDRERAIATYNSVFGGAR